MSAFPRLFSPVEVGRRIAKNRIVSTAHATGYGADGLIGEREVAYQERKAAGGAGIVMTFGSAGVSPTSLSSYGSISLWAEENEPALRELAERVHRHGALLISQATHMGRRGTSALEGGALLAPSPFPEPVHREIPHEMSRAEIAAVVRAFAACARRLEDCGWDGVEITSFGGHLIEQFFSPATNRRTDGYGGRLENRVRFAREVIDAVAESTSSSFVVGFRMTGDPLTDAIGLGPDDMLAIARLLDGAGRIDLFDVSGGTGATLASQAATVPPVYFGRGCYDDLARRFRENLSVPVLVAGRILEPSQAEEVIASGAADLVAMTRAIIADPDLPARAEAGEAGRIRPCISINEECIGRLYQGLPVRCAVNPAAGREWRGDGRAAPGDRPPAGGRRLVVVVGGGPAGLEAARAAAGRGHLVTLIEREEELGGQLNVAALAPERPEFDRYVRWLTDVVERLEVGVELGREATVDGLRELEPDAVIVATGSSSAIPEGAASSGVPCATDVDVLLGQADVPAGASVLVYDVEGRARGGSVALRLAGDGARRVELATDLGSVCEELDPTQKPSMYRLLAEREVICSPNQRLGRAGDAMLLVDTWSGRSRAVEGVDLVVFVGYRVAEAALGAELASVGTLPVTLVGDALAPRRLYDAVSEGARAGRQVPAAQG